MRRIPPVVIAAGAIWDSAAPKPPLAGIGMVTHESGHRSVGFLPSSAQGSGRCSLQERRLEFFAPVHQKTDPSSGYITQSYDAAKPQQGSVGLHLAPSVS